MTSGVTGRGTGWVVLGAVASLVLGASAGIAATSDPGRVERAGVASRTPRLPDRPCPTSTPSPTGHTEPLPQHGGGPSAQVTPDDLRVDPPAPRAAADDGCDGP